MQYEGSCHCGAIRFSVNTEIQKAIACNCSICQRRGHLLHFVPRSHVTFKMPETLLSTYTFNAHKIRHQFCGTCGIGTFSQAQKDGVDMVAVNVRCLENVDLDQVEVQPFDGRTLR